MSRITDAIDDAGVEQDEGPGALFAAGSGAEDTTRAAAERLAAGASALDALKGALERSGLPAEAPLRVIRWSRARGPEGLGGTVGALGRGALEVGPVAEGTYRGHEVFVLEDEAAPRLLLAAALASELPPVTEAEETTRIGACLAVAGADVAREPAMTLAERISSERIDTLLDALDDAPARAPAAAPSGFGVVLLDAAGEAVVACAGPGAPSPLLALRAHRPWIGLAGPVSDAIALRVLARRADRGLAGAAVVQGLAADLALVLSNDEGGLESPLADAGLAVIGAAQPSAASTSDQA